MRGGRARAFEAIYDRHHRAILAFCRHMLGDAAEAEDAVQHTFMAAYKDICGSSKEIQLRPWLFTIARNRCYSILRARREAPTAELEESWDTLTEGLAAQVQRRQDLRDLILDLRELPQDQRGALVLAELESLSHKEIGEVLGVPTEKVKALVFQARESLVASRAARETSCTEIREQLATLRGGALRRGPLRRHLRQCAGCRDFRKQVERQRRQLAVLLPVIPTVALREAVLGATVGAGASAGAGVIGGGLLASSVLKGGAGKLAAAIAVAIATAGGLVATEEVHLGDRGGGSAVHRLTALPAFGLGRASATAPAPTTTGLASAGAGAPVGIGAPAGARGSSRAGHFSGHPLVADPFAGRGRVRSVMGAGGRSEPRGAAPSGSAPAGARSGGAPAPAAGPAGTAGGSSAAGSGAGASGGGWTHGNGHGNGRGIGRGHQGGGAGSPGHGGPAARGGSPTSQGAGTGAALGGGSSTAGASPPTRGHGHGHGADAPRSGSAPAQAGGPGTLGPPGLADRGQGAGTQGGDHGHGHGR